MSVTPTSLTATGSAPSGASDLWTPAAYLLPNWGGGVKMRTSWGTSIKRSLTLAETRTARQDKPNRSLTYELTGHRASESILLRSLAQRMGVAGAPIPLACDVADVTTAPAENDEAIQCDTRYKRFFAGARVIVMDPPGAGSLKFPLWEFATIDTVDSGALNLSGPLSRSYSAAARVYPILEARLALASRMGLANYSVRSLGATFIEPYGPQSLDALVEPGAASLDGFDLESDGNPLFNLPFLCDEEQLVREGKYSELGAGHALEIYGDRPTSIFPMEFTFHDRSEAWRLLEFFDWRGGSLYPFWLAGPATHLELVSVSTTEAVVTATAPEIDFDYNPNLAIVFTDGTFRRREIASVNQSGAEYTLTFATPFEIGEIDNLTAHRVTTAHLCRFDSDEIIEDWITPTVMKTSLTAVEIDQEAEVEIEGLTETCD